MTNPSNTKRIFVSLSATAAGLAALVAGAATDLLAIGVWFG